jgi:serine/threonine-protein kinase
MRQAGRIPFARAAVWFDQILDGIAAAHREGVIHRDLKPENILLLPPDDRIKILDFGLAKMKLPDAAETGSITVPGTVLGTLCYMSPEQLTGQQVDQRSDLFSLGIMLVEVVTGSRPFEGNSGAELIHATLNKDFHLQTSDMGRLDAVIQKCIAKDRAHRFASAGDMRESLLPALRELQ